MIKLYQGCNKILKGKIHFDKEKSYIYEEDDKIIGYFNLVPVFGCMSIDYEILEEFRGRGLGNKFLEHITHYASIGNSEYEKLLLFIEYNNIRSKKIALKNGYTEDYYLLDGVDSELHNMNVYTKVNKYYKKGL